MTRRGTRGPRALVACALAAAWLGCDEMFPPEGPSDEERAAAAVMLAAQADEPIGPEEPSGESIDACLERVLQETPRSVQETIEAVGYVELLRDSCRARVAEEERSTAPCAQIEARLVRRDCESRVAIAARDPGLCPGGPRGHEPLCLALASRDRRLCQAAPHLEREACRELLGEADACGESIAAEMCADLVRRHRRRLPGGEPLAEVAPASQVEPELVVSFSRELPDRDPEALGEETRLEAFDRGGRIFVESGRSLLELADPLGLSVVSHAGRPSIVVRVPLPPPDGAEDARLDARVGALGASVEASHPELGTLRADEGEVHLTHLARELGGRVEGTFDVRCPAAAGEIRLEGHFRTFVRDVGGPLDGPIDGLEAADP